MGVLVIIVEICYTNDYLTTTFFSIWFPKMDSLRHTIIRYFILTMYPLGVAKQVLPSLQQLRKLLEKLID